MTIDEISNIISKQKEFFNSGKTLDVNFRISSIKKLKENIIKRKAEIFNALKCDLGKSEEEAYMCEVGLVLSEISYMIKHIKKFAKDKKVKTPLSQFHSHSYLKSSPYGNVLIMSPWNYPFLLTIEPLVDALSAGNTCVVKPSAYSPATSEVIANILSESFSEEYVAVVTGGRKENQGLLKCKWDKVFFTGSEFVGKEVLRNCAENLTPAILELGGKSPCIVDSSAKIDITAKRIVFGKFLNCGQTCVAPDYVLCDESIASELILALVNETRRQFGENPLENNNYGKIINEKHYERIMGLIDKEKVVLGGVGNKLECRISPTIMTNISFEDKVMGEEIFGPILPIITYKSLDEIVAKLQSLSSPLALYYFSSNKKNIRAILSNLTFGGGCVNDTIIHLASSNLIFGGVGASGIGGYHGKFGFDAFSHLKGIVDKSTWIDLPMRYQPYSKKHYNFIRKFLK